MVPSSFLSKVVGFMANQPRAENCPHCQWTLEEYRKSMLLGCPLCYEVFGEELKSESDPGVQSSEYSVSSTLQL